MFLHGDTEGSHFSVFSLSSVAPGELFLAFYRRRSRSSATLSGPAWAGWGQSNSRMTLPQDRNGKAVDVGSRVRLISLSGQWLEDLPADEKDDVLSMIGEIFEVQEIDEYGHPWVSKSWACEEEGRCHSHSVALERHEIELVDDRSLTSESRVLNESSKT